MKKQTRAWLLALGSLGSVATAGAQQEMYRCDQADGRIVFQQAPCPLAGMATIEPAPPRPAPKPVVVAPEAAPAASTPVAAPRKPAPERPVTVAPATAVAPKLGNSNTEDAAAKPTRRKREVLELTAQFERCRVDAPGFAEKSAPVYAAWTRRHAAVLSEFDKQLAAKIRAGRRGDLSLPLHLCTEDWLRRIEPLARMPDPRFHTVEKTWQVFMGALMTGDRATALSCLMGRAESRWKERVEAMSDDDLRRIGATIRALKVQWGDDYEKEGMVADIQNRTIGIAFRNVNEEWKITDWGGAATPLPLEPVTEKRSSPGS